MTPSQLASTTPKSQVPAARTTVVIRVGDALVEGARRWGGGSGASPLVSGHSAAHAAVADWLAQASAHHMPQARALGFCTGYMANLGVLTALGDAATDIPDLTQDPRTFCAGVEAASPRVAAIP